MVDDEDFEWLNQFKWHVSGNGYATNTRYIRGSGRRNQKSVNTYMHRMIMANPQGKKIDHIDGDGFNNQKSNLRVCSNAENSRNSSKSKSNTSGFKGVFLHDPKIRLAKPWRARLRFNRENYHLGFYTTKEEAARAYNEGALKYFGKYAKLNEL